MSERLLRARKKARQAMLIARPAQTRFLRSKPSPRSDVDEFRAPLSVSIGPATPMLMLIASAGHEPIDILHNPDHDQRQTRSKALPSASADPRRRVMAVRGYILIEAEVGHAKS